MKPANSNDIKNIVIISDGTGRTARRLMDAVLSQYSEHKVEYSLVKTYKLVRDRNQVDRILKDIGSTFLVISSIISSDLSEYISDQLVQRGILNLNVLEPMLSTMSKFLGVHPAYKPGLLQIIDDMYYNKVDAIGYTVEHDDGKGHFIEDADAILLGLSRTCKTPVSVYLACNMSIKVANIPVFVTPYYREQLLERLKKIDRKKIVGLTMKPEVLAHVREERARILGGERFEMSGLDSYIDMRDIMKEVKFCMELFQEMHIPIIDVTRRAIEEIAMEVLRRSYPKLRQRL